MTEGTGITGTASDTATPSKQAPLYEQVADRILRRILRRIVLGHWPEGHVLPAEADLALSLGVSYGTVRRAMADLAQQGVVVRRRRTGTVVTGRTPHYTLERFYRFYRLHAADGALVNTDTRVIETAIRPADAEEAGRLRLVEAAPVGAILRLRLAGGRPVMIDRIVLPLSRVGCFPATPEETPPLLYRWLLEQHGQRLGAVRERVTARLATPEDCALLVLDPALPHALLEIDETAFDPRNAPLLLMRHSALTDAHCYVNEVR